MVKCNGTTAQGGKCKRQATQGGKCWQHVNRSRSVVKRSQRCRSGYRKNSSGRCVRVKISKSRTHCSPGYRRNSRNRCVRKRSVSKKRSVATMRRRSRSVVKSKTKRNNVNVLQMPYSKAKPIINKMSRSKRLENFKKELTHFDRKYAPPKTSRAINELRRKWLL